MASPLAIYQRLPLMTRRSRRVAVVAAFSGYPLLVLGYAFLVEPGLLSTIAWVPIAVGLFSLTVIGSLALYGYGRGRMGVARTLDERERAMHDQALVLSYRVVKTVFGLAIGVLIGFAIQQGPLLIDLTALMPVLIGGLIYLPLLPFAALAWIEPDPPTDDEV